MSASVVALSVLPLHSFQPTQASNPVAESPYLPSLCTMPMRFRQQSDLDCELRFLCQQPMLAWQAGLLHVVLLLPSLNQYKPLDQMLHPVP